jgi:hypothetical protein
VDEFVYARVARSEAPLPKKFGASLPSSLAEFDDYQGPPYSYVEWALCSGDASMQSRFIAAIGKASASSLPDELSSAYQDMLGYCDTPAKCDWLAKSARQVSSLGAKSILYRGLEHCRDSKYQKAFAEPGAPLEALIDWHFASFSESCQVTPLLRAAAKEALVRAKSAYDARRIGVVLSSCEGPDAIAALVELQALEKNDSKRAALAVPFSDRSETTAKRLSAEACRHPEHKRDVMCSSSRGPTIIRMGGNEEDAQPESPLAEVRTYNFDAEKFAAKHPELASKIDGELRACAIDPEERSMRGRCLAILAERSVESAKKIAATVASGSTDDLTLLETAASLRLFESPASQIGQLREWRLVGEEARFGNEDKPSWLATDNLEALGSLHRFDTETGMFPNQHDLLLGELAQKAGGELQGIVFEEVPPSDVDMESGSYVLRAYIGGILYETSAENLGDWYDMGAVLGLLNSALRDRGSSRRFVALPTGDQTAAILVGPIAGLGKARVAGLITFGDPDAARQVGRAFEKKVMNELMQKHGDRVLRDVPVGKGGIVDHVVEETR